MEEFAGEGSAKTANFGVAGIEEQSLGGEIAGGGVVLMEGVDGDAFGNRSGCGSECFAEGIVAFVTDADPVDGTEDDWLPGAEEDDSPAAKGNFIDAADGVIGHLRAEGRGGVDVEGGEGDS